MRPLLERVREQARYCEHAGSPLTAALLHGAADDLESGGVVAELLGPEETAPPGSVPALRFAAALHRLVLERQAPELALHYASVGGTAPVDGVWAVAERACREHLDRLRVDLRRPVQTNEVGRSAVLWGCLGLVAAARGPQVRLLELGASAGLNLRLDRFAYEVGGEVLGDPRSPVRLREPWTATPPAYRQPEVVERRGCDPGPLDPTTTDGRLTLTSCVWADQRERLERLRGALAVAAEVPAVVEPSGALAFLESQLRDLPDGVTTVVWHSVVMQYVDPDERVAVEQLLDEVGRDAGPRLLRVSMEPSPEPGSPVFDVHLQSWPGGRVRVAGAEGHGPPVVWTGARLDA